MMRFLKTKHNSQNKTVLVLPQAMPRHLRMRILRVLVLSVPAEKRCGGLGTRDSWQTLCTTTPLEECCTTRNGICQHWPSHRMSRCTTHAIPHCAVVRTLSVEKVGKILRQYRFGLFYLVLWHHKAPRRTVGGEQKSALWCQWGRPDTVSKALFITGSGVFWDVFSRWNRLLK